MPATISVSLIYNFANEECIAFKGVKNSEVYMMVGWIDVTSSNTLVLPGYIMYIHTTKYT